MSKKSTTDFESSLSELEKVVSIMEEESIPLEDLLKHYEKGNLLVKECENALKAARKQLKTIRDKSVQTPQSPASSADQDDDEIRLF